MSSNGISNSSSIPQDVHIGGHQGRYRGQNSRRASRRGGQDRSTSSRGFRRSGFTNSTSRNVNNQTGVIDIHDSSQWPSIQESSTGSYPRQRASSQNEPAITSEENSMNEQKPFESRRSSYSRVSTSQSTPGNNNAVRDYGRYHGSRGRGGRYSTSRGHSNNYNKRFVRGGFAPFSSVYSREPPIIPNFLNGQIIFQAYPGVNMPVYDNRSQPPQLDPVKQVEYYFSPANLENDVFMRAQMDSEGWVDLNIIHQFKRISALNLPFDVFIEKLTASELLDVDTEKKRIRTKNEPEKWYLPEGRRYVPPRIEQGSPSLPSQYEQYNSIGLTAVGAPYGAIQPMFVPLQGYPRGSSRGRYMPQYGFYPAPYSNYSLYDVPDSYYYSPEGTDQYLVDQTQQGYFSVGDSRVSETDTQYSEEVTSENRETSETKDTTEPTESSTRQSEDIQSITDGVLKLEINEVVIN